MGKGGGERGMPMAGGWVQFALQWPEVKDGPIIVMLRDIMGAIHILSVAKLVATFTLQRYNFILGVSVPVRREHYLVRIPYIGPEASPQDRQCPRWLVSRVVHISPAFEHSSDVALSVEQWDRFRAARV